jgi:hypothetical protein
MERLRSTPAGRRLARRAALLAGAALGALAAVRLAAVLPVVASRHAFCWDPARRALLDLDAADALRRLDVAAYLWHVVEPETWPTLRLALAAPLHALAGPSHAFGVEQGLSIACYGAVAFGLALLARAVAPRSALTTLAVSAAALAGNVALLGHAANGMLEPLAAALTAAATAAWILARERRRARPWTLAFLGSLLFHVKFQYGLFFAASVMAVEALGGEGALRPRLATLAAVLRDGVSGARGLALSAATALLAAAAVAVSATGGFEVVLAGQRATARDAQGPLAFAALAAFVLAERALWRGRARLAEVFPERARFLWAWLATPMAAWLLVPFTWRLRTLLGSADFSSGEAPAGLGARLLYYPRAAWDGWTAPGVAPLVVGLLAVTGVAAWRAPSLRRRLAPVVAVVSVELLALALLSRQNFQQRLALNLAPLVAVASAASFAALRSLPLRAALAAAAALVLSVAAAPRWRTDALAEAMARGFDPAERGDACRRAALALAGGRAALVNDTPVSHVQGCTLWQAVVARQRGGSIELVYHPDARFDEVIVLSDCAHPAAPPAGFAASGRAFREEPVCGERYQRVPRMARP